MQKNILTILGIAIAFLFLLHWYGAIDLFHKASTDRTLVSNTEIRPDKLKVIEMVQYNLARCDETVAFVNTSLKTTAIVLSFLSLLFAVVSILGLQEIREIHKARHALQAECEASEKIKIQLRNEIETLHKIANAKYLYAQHEYKDAWEMVKDLPANNLYDVPYYQGLILYKDGNTNEAISLLEQAIKLAQNEIQRASAFCAMGNCWLRLNQLSKAEEWYDKALQVKGNYLPGFNGKARVLRRIGKIEEAIGILNTALALDKNYPVGHYNLACYHCLLKHLADAKTHLKYAIQLDEKYIDIAKADQDFVNLHNDQDFLSIINYSLDKPMSLH